MNRIQHQFSLKSQTIPVIEGRQKARESQELRIGNKGSASIHGDVGEQDV